MIKAAVMVKPGVLEVQKFPKPKISESEALMEIEYSGICGTDKHMFLGEVVHPGGVSTPFPIIPGHEIVGRITEIGEVARRKIEATGEELKPGDRIVPVCDVSCGACRTCRFTYGYVAWCEHAFSYGTTRSCRDPPFLYGGWSQLMYIHPNTLLFKLPDDIPPKVAVLTEPFAVAYGAYMKAMQPCSPVLDINGYSPGDDVVILGPGPIGLIHAIMARINGAGNVIVIGSGSEIDEWRLGYINKEFKDIVDYTVNLRSSDERVEEVFRLTGGRGADMAVECAGAPEAVVDGLKMLRDKGGTLLVLGVFIDVGRDIRFNPATLISHKNARIIGISNHPLQGYRNAFRLMRKYAERFSFNKIVTHTFPLEMINEAMATAISGKAIKVLINPLEAKTS
jgi:threonine dehydrogenase-like Zn-dependent dehydrogenase